jgi:hypothetical protein
LGVIGAYYPRIELDGNRVELRAIDCFGSCFCNRNAAPDEEVGAVSESDVSELLVVIQTLNCGQTVPLKLL